jgi:hypothetical protein
MRPDGDWSKRREASWITNIGDVMESDPNLEREAFWQTRYRGDNDSEYQIYLGCADDGEGNDFTTGKPLKTYEEWLSS